MANPIFRKNKYLLQDVTERWKSTEDREREGDLEGIHQLSQHQRDFSSMAALVLY